VSLLQVEGLSTGYGAIPALRDVSLEVAEGEIVTLLGANGAGKTTLLHTISGLLRPWQGRILFDGEPLHRLPPHVIVRMGITQVPEGRWIFSTMSVEENLRLGAFTTRGDLGSAFERVFTLFPVLAERRRQIAGTLSGGEQQMLAMARALMTAPRLLLLDEPSMGLGPMLVRAVFASIREINRTGVTILLVEQNANAALRVANRGLVMETGRIVLSGRSGELLVRDDVRRAYLGIAPQGQTLR